MSRITVALLGSRQDAFKGEYLSSQGPESWDEFEKCELEVEESETLGSILKRAGAVMEITGPAGESPAPVPPFFASFDEEGWHQATPMRQTVNLVNDDGRVRWNVPYESVTHAELRRAVQARATPGDPDRLYYTPWPAMGNGVIPTLLEVALALKVVYDLAVQVDDAVSLWERIRDVVLPRIASGQQSIESNASDWRSRGGDPMAIDEMLGDGPWATDELALLLGCSTEQAEGLLWAFGFAEVSGVWGREGDEAAKFLNEIRDEILIAHSLGSHQFQDTLEKRVRAYLETGERTPRPFVDARAFGDEDYASENPTPDDDFDDDDFEFDDEDLDSVIPLDDLRMVCGCAKDDCRVMAEFGIANGKLKIGLSDDVDHFVISAEFMALVAIQISEMIDEAVPD